MSLINNPVGAITGYLGQQVGTNGYGHGGSPQEQEYQNYLLQQQFRHQYQNQQNLQAQTYAGQGNLANQFYNTINNQNAPSVAAAQLGQGVSAADSAAIGQAAQGTGEQNALLQRQAMQQAGANIGQANQQAAVVRAQEVANAQQGLGQLYASQLGAQGQQANTAAGAAIGAGNTNASVANTTQQTNAAAQQQNAKTNSNLIGTLGGALAAFA